MVVEREGISIDNLEPGPWRRFRSQTMWLPILRFEDGYGFTYGARMSLVNVLGKRSRVSVPLSWGGERRASVEVERGFEHGPLTRVLATGGVWRREHPSLDIGDRREGATLLAERAVTPWFRVGVTGSLQSIHFGDTEDTLRTAGFEATLDTRGDPAFPRNAIYASLGWIVSGSITRPTRIASVPMSAAFSACSDRACSRCGCSRSAARIRCPSLNSPCWAARRHSAASARLPLRRSARRGDAGAAHPDLVAAEHRPRRHRHLRHSGATYDAHTTLDHAKFDTGIGAGWFLQLPVLSFRIDVAHGLGGSTRAHVTLGVTF